VGIEGFGGVAIIHIAQGHDVFIGKSLDVESAPASDPDACEIDPAIGGESRTADRETRRDPETRHHPIAFIKSGHVDRTKSGILILVSMRPLNYAWKSDCETT
jgi:hypothetical protein